MKRFATAFCGLALAGILSVGPADAQTVHRDWESHATEHYCYNVSFPTASTHTARPYRTYVAATQRPLENIADEISFVSGLNPDADFLGTVKIDNHAPMALLVHEGSGFVSSEQEPELLRRMLRGYKMTVTWTFQTGQEVLDEYSLMGFTASRNAAKRAC